jgi:predicted SprT family Zn-dependent metalloprotease
MWTIERITERCIDYCGRCGVEFNSPVGINGRLTRTLGRCIYKKVDSVWQPTRIEISRQLLETSPDNCIEEVIAHECAHYVVCAITHEMHGHDATFRFYCHEIGTTNDQPVYKNLERIVEKDKVYKYSIYCSKCGKYVGGKSRACNVTKYPHNFTTNCCGAKINVIQNW